MPRKKTAAPPTNGASPPTTDPPREAEREADLGALPADAAPAARPSVRAEAPDSTVLPVSVLTREVPKGAPLDDPSLFLNRELSWLDFNWRVFFQALDPRVPLLERVSFVAIAANNLDEFYRKRVGGLKRQVLAGVRAQSPDGRSAREQLDLTLDACQTMQAHLVQAWTDTLQPALEKVGVVVRDYRTLSDDEQEELDAYFHDHIFPILTPLAVDPGHPFPFISNLSLSLAFSLRHPTRGTEHFARLKVPTTTRGRWVPIPGKRHQFVALEDLIRFNAGDLFRGMEVESAHAFRVTRNADVDRNEDDADDLLAMISEELRERRFAEVVRLEVDAEMPDRVRELLRRELHLDDPRDVIQTEGILDLTSLFELSSLDLPAHRYLPWEAIVPIRLRHTGELDDQADIFSAIRAGDILVHHPYESFAASTLRFLEEAAADDHVVAIKQTLYRTSKDSPIVRALIRAAENGKQVAVLVELKARFDEQNNIEWAQALEKAGAHVTYGLIGLKTHAKTTLVVREEGGQVKTYCHLGTGNYNPSTAKLYTDFGLLTADETLGDDLVNLFHYLTGYAPEQHYEKLVLAPRELRARFVQMIRREVRHHEAHGNGRLIAKMNALDDTGIIRELYRASQAGVKIDLVVRGHCRLRPGVPGVSDTIRVVSIIGRFLEHSRIYYAYNNGEPETYIGSADWMRRNLDDRVEVMLPVEDEHARKRLLRTLAFCLEDNRQAWELGADGRYTLRHPAEGEETRALHDTLMRRARKRTKDDDAAWSL